MCGIGAFQIVKGECEPAMVARVLLRLLEVRGRDASGVAYHNKGETYIVKAAMSGSALAKQLDSDIGSTGIVHTRWATQGNPNNNKNNHPIDVGGVVGVHNGHISNDNELLSYCVDYQRQAQVDSEAVFALIAHGTKGVRLCERLAKVRGSAALLWLRTQDKHERLHIARLQSSPLVLGQTKGGSLIAASTEGILRETAKRCNLVLDLVHTLPEGTYVRAEGGTLAEMQSVRLAPPVFMPAHTYGTPSKYAAALRQGIPQPLSRADEMTLDDMLDERAAADYEETRTLREALDKQYGYTDRRW